MTINRLDAERSREKALCVRLRRWAGLGLTALAITTGGSAAQGASIWTGGGTPTTVATVPNVYLWSDAANWVADAGVLRVPNNNDTNDLQVIFGATTNTLSDIDNDRRVAGMTFTGDANYTTNAIKDGGVIYAFGATPLTVQGGTQTFNAALRLREGPTARTLLNNGTALMNGGIMYHNTAGSTALITLTVDGSGQTTVSRFERRNATGDLAVVKNGTGTLLITAASSNAVTSAAGTIEGGYTVNNGVLQVGANSSTAASIARNAVRINSGGTLAGTGTLSATTVFGNLRPGETNGTARAMLSFSDTLRLEASSITTLQLTAAEGSTATPGTLTDPSTMVGTDDFIRVTNALTIASGATIHLNFTGYTASWGDVFDLFDFGSMAAGSALPTFTVESGTLPADWYLDTSRFMDLGVVIVVPEPSRMLLLALGGMVLLGARRRRVA